jgi:hypothetical protein
MIDEKVELEKTSYSGVELPQRMDCAKSEPRRNGAPSKISLIVILVGPSPSASLLSIFNLTNRKTSPNAISILVILAPSTFLRAPHHHHATEDGDASTTIKKFGTVDMPISCAASVQVPFERGVALPHSFWGEEVKKQFQTVASANPRRAMTHWGLAMTEWRPFWDGMPEHADMLLVDNYSIEDLVHYRTALKWYPNRFNGLYKADRAAEAAGKPDEAQTYYKQLMKITSDGIQTQRPEIAYAGNFLRN